MLSDVHGHATPLVWIQLDKAPTLGSRGDRATSCAGRCRRTRPARARRRRTPIFRPWDRLAWPTSSRTVVIARVVASRPSRRVDVAGLFHVATNAATIGRQGIGSPPSSPRNRSRRFAFKHHAMIGRGQVSRHQAVFEAVRASCVCRRPGALMRKKPRRSCRSHHRPIQGLLCSREHPRAGQRHQRQDTAGLVPLLRWSSESAGVSRSSVARRAPLRQPPDRDAADSATVFGRPAAAQSRRSPVSET